MSASALEGHTTPLHGRHLALGAKMVPFGGWIMPVQYTQVIEEHHAVRTRAGVFDLSHMGEFHFEGAGAQADLQSLLTNDVSHLDDGQALYSPMCNARGTIVDDVVCYRLSSEHYLLVVNAANLDKDRAWVKAHLSARTRFRDESFTTALIALQGPAAVSMMDTMIPGASALGKFRCATLLHGHARKEVLVARTGYTGEDGFEVFSPNALAAGIFDTMLAAGAAPIGLGARDTLRFEARLLLYGNDIDETTTPLEAGLAWTVKFDKGPFVGKEALQQQKTQGVPRRLVGFRMVGRGIARHGYPIKVDGAPSGTVTSGTFSPTLKVNLGLGYVPTQKAVEGHALMVEIRGKDVEAQIVKTPFYKASAPAPVPAPAQAAIQAEKAPPDRRAA